MTVWIDSSASRRRLGRWLAAGAAVTAGAMFVWPAAPLEPPPATAPPARVTVASEAATPSAPPGRDVPPTDAVRTGALAAQREAGFDEQLFAMVNGRLGGAELWAVFQRGTGSAQTQQRVLAYRALRLCAAASPPFNAYAAPLVERPAWLSDLAAAQADRARTELLQRCAPFASMRPDERLRWERDLGSTLDAPARPGRDAMPDEANAPLAAERAHLRDTFGRYGVAALAWAGAALAEYTEAAADRAAADRTQRSPSITRLGRTIPELALCEVSDGCAADSNAALSFCYATGNCEGSLRDRLLAEFRTDAERDHALLQARQLISALRSGNLRRYGM